MTDSESHVPPISRLAAQDGATILREAARLIRERGWTQRRNAATASGEAADPPYTDAVCFCAEGAIVRAKMDAAPRLGPRRFDAHDAAMDAMRVAIGARVVHRWNDTDGRTREEVLDAFERAETWLKGNTQHTLNAARALVARAAVADSQEGA
jgi:hypothetical protein